MQIYKRKDIYKTIWTELELFLKSYQDISERHRILYNHVRNMLINSIRTENSRNPNDSIKKLNVNQAQIKNAEALAAINQM